MAISINSPGWRIRRAGTARGPGGKRVDPLPGLPPQFLTPQSRVTEEAVLDPPSTTRGGDTGPGSLDINFDVEAGETAVLAVRHPSQALTFHVPIESTSRGPRAQAQVRFQVPAGRGATRGLASAAIKAILIRVAKLGADKTVSILLPKLAAAVERGLWNKRGLREGWVGVTPEALAAGTLRPRVPVSPERSLLLLHGTFSDAASAFRSLATPGLSFFSRVHGAYGDRIFAYNHFSVSRTPEDNARMLLEALPDQATTFDVITHSRGGLVLRTLVEGAEQFGGLGARFQLNRAVLVAAPNDGTPLATAARWDQTVGWLANVLELFPDNPFTTGAEFVGNALVWLANHVTGDLPGLHAMATDGEAIGALQGPPRPPENAYSALVANYQPAGNVLQRLIDSGLDQFFASANDLVVPSEGGWRVDRSTKFIPGDRIGCFGPGGNLPGADVTHINILAQERAPDFLVNALLGQSQRLEFVDPRKALPDRRMLRRDMVDAPMTPARAPGAGRRPVAARSTPVVDPPLRITVVNGDLTFESEALLLGHYRAMKLTGTEAVMDRLVGGAMQRSLRTGVYPVAVGTHQVFVNRLPNLERGSFLPRPRAVIVAGLGDEGQLAPHDLVETVRKAVIAWAQRLAEDQKSPGATTDLAATLLGSGGTGIGAGDAALLIAQGVREANAFIAEAFEGRLPRVHHLRLIELYLERAADAWRALSLKTDAAVPGFVLEGAVRPGVGPLLRQPDSSYRGAEFDFITVESRQERDGTPSIAYTLDTKRARSEVRAHRTQGPLVGELVATASNDVNTDEQIGRTLFDLLVPPQLDAYLVGRGELQISLDPQTAPIPWELLDTTRDRSGTLRDVDGERDLPWAIRVKLLRKLRLQDFRESVSDSTSDATVLVIGEPACAGPRLFGARTEALAVAQCFRDAGKDVSALISEDESEPGADARTIINTLFEQPWRIVHVAGHGVPGTRAGAGEPVRRGGVVLSSGTYLGPEEIGSLRTVPALVFLNCCHVGRADPDELLKTYNRAEFASGVAGALIQVGVRCVVAAGWAVDDDGARVFAETFYRSLIEGQRFISAVGRARLAAYEANPHSNTWAAYQCYGDPDWVFSDSGAVVQKRDESPARFPSATSLRFALEEIIVQSRFQGRDPATQARRLTDLAKIADDPDKGWGAAGDVAELFGSGFTESGDLEQGRRWYERAVAAADGRASLQAAEQLANVKGRLAWQLVDEAVRHRDAMKARGRGLRSASERQAARRALAAAETALSTTVARANRLIDDALATLDKLSALETTMERESLTGSALKRRVLANTAAGRRYAAAPDLRRMLRHYLRAEQIGIGRADADLYYPASNCLSADIAMHAGRHGWKGPDRARVARLTQMLADRSARDPNFWGVIGEIDMKQYSALAGRRLRKVAPGLAKAYADLHNRVRGTRMWATVYDNACFVLSNYRQRTTGLERDAAVRILAQLRSFAFPESG